MILNMFVPLKMFTAINKPEDEKEKEEKDKIRELYIKSLRTGGTVDIEVKYKENMFILDQIHRYKLEHRLRMIRDSEEIKQTPKILVSMFTDDEKNMIMNNSDLFLLLAELYFVVGDYLKVIAMLKYAKKKKMFKNKYFKLKKDIKKKA
ncbi:hypothetical protein TCON_1548 [Astathelohania contejeani]|uniref:Uncharacterized protein n=1 Tax=Astathelohania contejeani TaxID=164912 RepID=A0ABQ7HYH9_9MICR|nr:hypothetical protein TCON_1548 [Thelohania contejeani]